MTSLRPSVVAWLTGSSPWKRWLVALLAGVGVTLALPPIYALPLLLLSFPLIIILLDSATRLRSVIGLGWFFGVGHMVSGLYWVGNALEIAGAPPALAFLLPLSMAFYPAIAAALYWGASRWLQRREWLVPNSLLAGALFALCWLIGEGLRGTMFTGFPWNLVGYSWAFSDMMSQGASLVGAYGLSFVTVFVATTPLSLLGVDLRRAYSWGAVGVGTAVVVALAGFGYARLSSAGDTEFHDIHVRIVQANIQQKDKWRADLRTDNFIRHLVLSEKPGVDKVDLLVWPETAAPYYLDEDPGRTVMMGRILKPGGLIVTGVPRREVQPDGSKRFFNSLVVIGADGVVLDTFDKFHLVPFGEYVPLRGLLKLLGVEKVVEGSGDFSSGVGLRTLDLPGMPSMSPLICYEVIFPGAVVAPGPRPGFLMNVTNDAWYGKSTGPYQHLMITRFRAIEEGLPILRAAGTGISAIIDAQGRVVRQLGLDKSGIIDGLLPKPMQTVPLFVRLQGWSVLGIIVIVFSGIICGSAISHRISRQKNKTT